MKIKKITIKEFRHMNDLVVEFGDNLTAIAGQNGTGKSTILGLVGQIFDYKSKERTKNNLQFATKYSEIFRFCPINDINSNHEYEALILDIEGNELLRDAKSRLLKETKKTKVGKTKKERFRIDIGDRQTAGEGAINFPVIYLGLKRLFPLAQEKEDSIKIKPLKLDASEKNFYKKYAKDILILLDQTVNPQNIKSPNKEFLAMETKKYSNLGNSAGQDNLGQILTAVLSFRGLKEKLKERYQGGILLIDEIDATLYAGSQINLIKRLYRFSQNYNLQIIFTTHSLEILGLLKEKDDWATKINFFETRDNKVKNILDLPVSNIRNKIFVQTKQEEKIEKTHVLCEDENTEAWCKNLINGTDLKKNLLIKKVPISAGTLKELAQKKHIAFKKMLFVLDGDYRKDKAYNKIGRVVFLPEEYYPEKVMYNYLNSLSEEDDFWENNDSFTKQFCFNGFMDINSKSRYKDWFKSKKRYFGSAYTKLFNRWKKDNSEIVKEFQEIFTKEFLKIKSS
jgi:predicted ATP-binding protein involved in virulence